MGWALQLSVCVLNQRNAQRTDRAPTDTILGGTHDHAEIRASANAAHQTKCHRTCPDAVAPTRTERHESTCTATANLPEVKLPWYASCQAEPDSEATTGLNNGSSASAPFSPMSARAECRPPRPVVGPSF